MTNSEKGFCGASVLDVEKKLPRSVFATTTAKRGALSERSSAGLSINISMLKNGTARPSGLSDQQSMIPMSKNIWESGPPPSTYLKLTDEDARAYAEYLSMLRLPYTRSSSVSEGPARLRKYPKPGDASVIGAHRHCRVI